MRQASNQSQWIGGHSLGSVGSGKHSWFSFSLIHSYNVYGAFRLKDCDLWGDSLQEESQIPPGWLMIDIEIFPLARRQEGVKYRSLSQALNPEKKQWCPIKPWICNYEEFCPLYMFIGHIFLLLQIISTDVHLTLLSPLWGVSSHWDVQTWGKGGGSHMKFSFLTLFSGIPGWQWFPWWLKR